MAARATPMACSALEIPVARTRAAAANVVNAFILFPFGSAICCGEYSGPKTSDRSGGMIFAEDDAVRQGLPPSWIALLLLAYTGLGLLVYQPALDGAFISDDSHYVRDNAYIHELNARNVVAILNPMSVVSRRNSRCPEAYCALVLARTTSRGSPLSSEPR